MERERVIYLRNIIKQAKKQYIQNLKSCKDWKDWNYYRFYLWNLVFKPLVKDIEDGWKNNQVVYVKYGKILLRLPVMKFDYLERLLLNKFWDKVINMEYRIRDKVFPYLERKLGKFKNSWE
jgi:hypothetical protein